jgi:hypothetical protein
MEVGEPQAGRSVSWPQIAARTRSFGDISSRHQLTSTAFGHIILGSGKRNPQRDESVSRFKTDSSLWGSDITLADDVCQ